MSDICWARFFGFIIISPKYSNLNFSIEINDIESLKNLDSIIPYISESEDEITVKLSDDLFLENNPSNARELIIQNDVNENYNNKRIKFQYRDMKFDSLEQIYDLERKIELIKSHIPPGSRKLDIVTYFTLFMKNYFNYDYNLYTKIKEEKYTEEDYINLFDLINNGNGICDTFASLTKYLLESFNIKCERVDYYSSEPGKGHAFNVVEIDGVSYFLDNTWVVCSYENKSIRSLSESSDFLRSNKDFGHEEYADTLDKYSCETYDRQEIEDSVNRVMGWNKNYTIYPQALRDLFRKHVLKREKSIEEKIEDAIPRRRIA